jgi:mannonate dehydratase
MQESWRWFGPEDPVSLRHILQAGANAVVTALHHIPTGEAWPLEEIRERKRQIETAGLTWSVVESIPLHNDLKTRSGNYQQLLANYITSVRNVGQAGIKTVCYNFMPVVDWTRTSLAYTLPNGSQALRFEMMDFAAYDVWVLKRPGAEADYDPALLARAQTRFNGLRKEERLLLEKNIIAGLPGGEGSYDREGIRSAIAQFIALGTEGLRDNLLAFLEAVLPAAEDAGVRMCIHPDDPPFSLFGLPRVVSTAEDAQIIFSRNPSPSNGLTLCAGSFGARADNDLVAIARQFGERIYFVHLRNIRREADGSFYESDHLEGDNDMVGLIDALLVEEERRRQDGNNHMIAMRPDHGHLLEDEIGVPGVNPGYSYGGRLKGLSELRGVIHTLTTLRARNR